jgi:predicted  nucleic acid-binding Zn-ribbon protein
MKREDLKKLLPEGTADDVIDKIMAMHGQDIEGHKTKLSTAETEAAALKKQLTDANTTIEGFKKLDVDAIKAAADEWKAKAEAAQTEAAAQVSALKFEHALESALTGAKARNAKAVKALLDAGALKLNEADGSIIGLKEQLEKIKSENEYLFEGESGDPKIVAKTNNQTILTDPVINAARRAAGLVIEGEK